MSNQKNIVIILMIFIFSCGEDIIIPTEQTLFSESMSQYKKQYTSASTDAKESKAKSERSKFIKSKTNMELNDWHGKVIAVTSSYVEVKSNGIEYTLEPTDDLDYSIFEKGEHLLFSGLLDRTYFFDTPKNPGFYVKCHIIKTYDQSKTYLSAAKYKKPEKKQYSTNKKKTRSYTTPKKTYKKTYYCNYCGDSYTGRGYATVMKVVNRVKDESSPFNSYCSYGCAADCIRYQCYSN